MNTGFFIALEGIDGSGKTTLRASLADWIKTKTGRDVLVGWEPKHESEGVWAAMIRSVLQGKTEPPGDPFEFQRLYVLDRAEDVHFKIVPELKKGNVVLYDRYAFSTIAYGMLSDIPVERLLQLHADVIGPSMVFPKVNIVLDLDPAVALSRKSGQYDKPELFEKAESLSKIRQAYLTLAEDPRFKPTTFIVDANRPLSEVEQSIRAILEPLL
jgi:dTMP kinase